MRKGCTTKVSTKSAMTMMDNSERKVSSRLGNTRWAWPWCLASRASAAVTAAVATGSSVVTRKNSADGCRVKNRYLPPPVRLQDPASGASQKPGGPPPARRVSWWFQPRRPAALGRSPPLLSLLPESACDDPAHSPPLGHHPPARASWVAAILATLFCDLPARRRDRAHGVSR